MISKKKIIIIYSLAILLLGLACWAYFKTDLFFPERAEIKAQILDFRDQEKDLKPTSSSNDWFRVYFGLATAYRKLGQSEQALAELDKARGKIAGKADYWDLHAQITADMGEYDKAIEDSKKAILIGGHSAEYWRTYFAIKQKQDPNVSLNNLYEQALKETNNNIDVILLYARYSADRGQKDKAIELYRKAIELDPEYRPDYEQQIERAQNS